MAVEESIEREYYRVSDHLLYERANIEECRREKASPKPENRPSGISAQSVQAPILARSI